MNEVSNPPRILVLAGQRRETTDPLARTANVSHKCMVPVHGKALIGHVLNRLESAFPEARLYVSIEDATAISSEPSVARLLKSGRLEIIEAERNLVDSVSKAAQTTGFPLLITTGDNILLTSEAVKAMLDKAAAGDADAILLVARKEDIIAAHPDGKGRYYELSNGSFSTAMSSG